jgi:hypothetical protein
MLSDELLVRTFYRSDGASGNAQIHSVPTAFGSPSVSNYKSGVTVPVHLVRHGQGHVILAIDDSRYGCNEPARNDLLDKNNASSDFVSFQPTNVKPEVYLVEVAMKRKGDAQYFGFQETKPNKTDKGLFVPSIQFRSGRDNLEKQARVYFKVEHCKEAPFCLEKHIAKKRTPSPYTVASRSINEQAMWPMVM